jgi:hypothetical protein
VFEMALLHERRKDEPSFVLLILRQIKLTTLGS